MVVSHYLTREKTMKLDIEKIVASVTRNSKVNKKELTDLVMVAFEIDASAAKEVIDYEENAGTLVDLYWFCKTRKKWLEEGDKNASIKHLF